MSHVATITIDHTKVAGDLTDYVVAVIPNSDAGWAQLYAIATEGGGDIRVFKSDDATELARELVTFTVAGEAGEIYIKYSGTLSSSVDTDIHIYADGSSADYAVTDTYGRNAVWSDFEAVYHFNSLTTDYTGNGNTLTDAGTVGNSTSPLGVSADFGASNTTKYLYRNSDMGINKASAYTISFLFKVETLPASGYNTFFTRLASSSATGVLTRTGYEYVSPANYRLRYFMLANSPNEFIDKTVTLSTSTWYYGSVIWDTADLFAYDAGASFGTYDKVGTYSHSSNAFSIGSNSSGSPQDVHKGELDEFRIRAGALSANWQATEYNNHSSASTFYGVAAITPGPGGFTPTPMMQMQMAAGGI